MWSTEDKPDDGITIPAIPTTARNPLRNPLWPMPLYAILDAEERMIRAKAAPEYGDLLQRLAA